MRLHFLSVLAVNFLLASAVAQQGNSNVEIIGRGAVKGVPYQVTAPDVEAEVALGRTLARELERGVTLVNDPALVEYVNRITQNLTKNEDSGLAFTINVIDSAEANAAGLRGGFLYVNTGLIEAAENEAQLAAMISHVIALAQVARRRAAMQQGAATLANVVSLPLPSTVFPRTASVAPQPVFTGLPSSTGMPTFIGLSRSVVEEADWLGLWNLYKAGYDPGAMVAFFQKMTTRNGGGKAESTIFSSHPQTEDRIAKSINNIRTFLPVRQQNIVTTLEFQAIKSRLMERRPK